MTVERELELLKKDYDELNSVIQNKVDAAVNIMLGKLQDGKITVNQAYSHMEGIFDSLNGLDKSNFLVNLLDTISKMRVGVVADVAEAGDFLVMRVQGTDTIKIVKVVREIKANPELEKGQEDFRKVVNHIRTKQAGKQ